MKRRGADVKVRIDGAVYAVQRVRVGDHSAPLNVSNSEGETGNPVTANAPGFMTKTPDLRDGVLQLVSATFDDEQNPFASPINIASGNWYDVKVYPTSDADGEPIEPPHDLGNVLCSNVSHDFNIPGLQPVTIDFETDGQFNLSGEVLE